MWEFVEPRMEPAATHCNTLQHNGASQVLGSSVTKLGFLPQRKKERKKGNVEAAKEPRIGATNQTLRE